MHTCMQTVHLTYAISIFLQDLLIVNNVFHEFLKSQWSLSPLLLSADHGLLQLGQLLHVDFLWLILPIFIEPVLGGSEDTTKQLLVCLLTEIIVQLVPHGVDVLRVLNQVPCVRLLCLRLVMVVEIHLGPESNY